VPRNLARGVGNFHLIPLGSEEVDKPAAHSARTTDDEDLAPGALGLGRDTTLLLDTQRISDEEFEEAVGKVRRNSHFGGGLAPPFEHDTFLLEIPKWFALFLFLLADGVCEASPLSEQLQEVLASPNRVGHMSPGIGQEGGGADDTKDTEILGSWRERPTGDVGNEKAGRQAVDRPLGQVFSHGRQTAGDDRDQPNRALLPFFDHFRGAHLFGVFASGKAVEARRRIG
jgi:hypothetical protein